MTGTQQPWPTSQQDRRGWRPSIVGVGMVVLALGAVGAGVGIVFNEEIFGPTTTVAPTAVSSAPEMIDADDRAAAQASADAFAAAWTDGDLGRVAYAGRPSTDVVEAYDALVAGLLPAEVSADSGEVEAVTSTLVRAPLAVTWTFDGDLQWVTETAADVELVGGEWLLRWEPSVVESTLLPGDELRRTRLGAARAPILARDGSILVDDVSLVVVGVQPSRIDDLDALAARLQELIGTDPAVVTAEVGAASPDAFVELATLPRADYELIRDDIFPLPGTVFREISQPLAVDPDLARAILGRSGEITAEILEANPEQFAVGDFVGLSGLQEQYNTQLAGFPGLRISVIRAAIDPSSTTTGTGVTTTTELRRAGVPETLFTADPVNGDAVQLTIDPAYQRAAESALEATELPSALVAIDARTGEILALANGPRGATVDFASTGQYPPGSIFKVVSGYAILRDRLDPEGPINCPPQVEVGGRSFGNVEGEVEGVISFRQAFALSCNTAFVNASFGYGNEVLNQAGADFGLGRDWDPGIPAFTGSVPVNTDPVDLAAAAFGQGRLLLSPLSAAVMSSTAAVGRFQPPTLVVGADSGPAADLEPGPAADLRDLMREVVTNGTGRAVSAVPGGPVSGKTGTAEFGNEVPPRSHAWFVGFQGPLAFAVFVEGGEFGGSTAAPIAGQFLATVAGLPDPGPVVSGGATTTTTTPGGADPTPTDQPTTTAPIDQDPTTSRGDDQDPTTSDTVSP